MAAKMGSDCYSCSVDLDPDVDPDFAIGFPLSSADLKIADVVFTEHACALRSLLSFEPLRAGRLLEDNAHTRARRKVPGSCLREPVAKGEGS